MPVAGAPEIVLLSADSDLRARITAGLAAVCAPVSFAPGPDGCTLLLIDAPDLSGHDLFQRAPTRPHGAAGQRPSVILLSDTDGAEAREAALRAGAADVFRRDAPVKLIAARALRLMATHAAQAETLALSDHAFGNSPPVDPSARMLVSASLSARLSPVMPCRTATFDSAGGAPAAASGASPDLIALTGAEALRCLPGLLAHQTTRAAPVVAFASDDAVRAHALRLGAADAIAPAASDTEITLRLTRLIEEKQAADLARTRLRAGLDLSYSDALTSLRNRRFFDQRFASLFQRARLGDRDLSVLMFDIDGFKTVNDRLGHAAGDAVLREFSQRLTANVRANDLVARYGGEEFIIATPDASMDVATRAAERVRAAIAAPGFRLDDGTVANITVSAGVATITTKDNRPEDMLARADAALFTAKGLGRNRIAQAA